MTCTATYAVPPMTVRWTRDADGWVRLLNLSVALLWVNWLVATGAGGGVINPEVPR